MSKHVLSGECDCAFVKKAGSEDTLFGVWEDVDTSNALSGKTDSSEGNYVFMVGYASEGHVGEIIDDQYDTTTSPIVQNTMKVDYAMADGDSGGAVTDSAIVYYVGSISSKNTLGGYTAFVPWSHIDAGLDLQ